MSVRGRQDLEIQGPRLNNTKEEKTSIKYGPDRRLDPIITEEMPLLEVQLISDNTVKCLTLFCFIFILILKLLAYSWIQGNNFETCYRKAVFKYLSGFFHFQFYNVRP